MKKSNASFQQSPFFKGKKKHETHAPPIKKTKDKPSNTTVNATNNQGWESVAQWYDKLVGDQGSDYHQKVIFPALLEMLDVQQDSSLVDLCCGQGILLSLLQDKKLKRYLGVDASKTLIHAARKKYGRTTDATEFIITDVTDSQATWCNQSYDRAVCLLAVHDVNDVDGLFQSMAKSLKMNGQAVLVMMHPCFRIPKQSHWGWDADQKIQYRRLDRYASELQIPITTHPGRENSQQTIFYHRSLATLLTALGKAGLAITESRELLTHRRSPGSGPFSKAEHRAAEEFPVFLALKMIKWKA